ncbi:MAG: ABC transporter ATP-binding protein/permease [Microscillaceae bacterium]|jgi:ABC-type bacteriocin/lantibiotic exporter with double-glycine peptidase domain|nr:ABC transporter ATP-binding protein/permease [Microscillaceae bacterium]
MNTVQIDKIVTKLAELTKQEYNYFDLKEKYAEAIEYQPNEVGKFINHLMTKSQKINLTLLQNHISRDNFQQLVKSANFPLLVFSLRPDNYVEPIIIAKNERGYVEYYDIGTGAPIKNLQEAEFINSLLVYQNSPDINLDGGIIFLTAFPLKHIAGDYHKKDAGKEIELTPMQRLFRLLQAEKRDIGYIYVYAVVVGLISLTLPLGIQATISMISGGMFFSSVIVLIALVILGILVGGALQIMQITLVEILQQRIFAKAAFEIAYRVTRFKAEALQKYYPPELMNRFFDIVTIQKGLPKLFVEITGAVIQIIFGLILLSLYHPFFLIFSVFLVGIVTAIFYLTGPNGLRTSIVESKYKYKIAYWLEELARTLTAFKQAGNTSLPLQKMDELVNNYLYYRKSHFKVLLTQFTNIVAFKTLITGGLLIIGTLLVVDRQITLGQFVASEVIIILVVGSVEKLIVSMDVIYDLLTGVDKVGYLTDIPLERTDGLRIPLDSDQRGVHISGKHLKYKYPGGVDYTLQGLDFEIQAGESVCIAGPADAGKHTLVKILLGSLDSFEGILTLNHLSIRDLDLGTVRDYINKTLDLDEIFDGTILDNITMGRNNISYKDVIWAIDSVGLSEYIASLKEGLHTHIGASGKKLSGGVLTKLLLARSVASRPKLLIVNDFSEHIHKSEKLKILSFLREKSNGWTLIILSVNDDPILLSSCDKIILMNDGKIAAKGSYEQLLSDKNFQNLIFKGK